MKLHTLHLLALAHQGLLAFAQDKPSPEEVAKCDGLSKQTGLQFTTVPDGQGGYNCAVCAGTTYTNPKTGVQDCCTGKKLFKTDAVATKEGACCDKEQIYSFDSASGKGSCCASGETFTGGKCQVPKKDPPPATVPDVPAKDPCNKCSSNFVCACEGTLGIKYGKCYTMTDVNGLQLNRDVAGTYQSGGDIGNLIFKVCKTTKNCDESSGTPVPSDGMWSLQDQLGGRTTPGPGWFGDIFPHMGLTNIESQAAVFKGEPFCMFGDCSICLRLGKGIYGLGISAPCPLGPQAAMAHLGAAPNPNNCKAYRFQEVDCLKTVAVGA